MVRGKPCWPSLQFKREEAKLPDGPRRFFDSSASWLHVGRWAMGALTYFIFLVEGLYRRVLSRSRSSRGKPSICSVSAKANLC